MMRAVAGREAAVLVRFESPVAQSTDDRVVRGRTRLLACDRMRRRCEHGHSAHDPGGYRERHDAGSNQGSKLAHCGLLLGHHHPQQRMYGERNPRRRGICRGEIAAPWGASGRRFRTPASGSAATDRAIPKSRSSAVVARQDTGIGRTPAASRRSNRWSDRSEKLA